MCFELGNIMNDNNYLFDNYSQYQNKTFYGIFLRRNINAQQKSYEMVSNVDDNPDLLGDDYNPINIRRKSFKYIDVKPIRIKYDEKIVNQKLVEDDYADTSIYSVVDDNEMDYINNVIHNQTHYQFIYELKINSSYNRIFNTDIKRGHKIKISKHQLDIEKIKMDKYNKLEDERINYEKEQKALKKQRKRESILQYEINKKILIEKEKILNEIQKPINEILNNKFPINTLDIDTLDIDTLDIDTEKIQLNEIEKDELLKIQLNEIEKDELLEDKLIEDKILENEKLKQQELILEHKILLSKKLKRLSECDRLLKSKRLLESKRVLENERLLEIKRVLKSKRLEDKLLLEQKLLEEKLLEEKLLEEKLLEEKLLEEKLLLESKRVLESKRLEEKLLEEKLLENERLLEKKLLEKKLLEKKLLEKKLLEEKLLLNNKFTLDKRFKINIRFQYNSTDKNRNEIIKLIDDYCISNKIFYEFLKMNNLIKVMKGIHFDNINNLNLKHFTAYIGTNYNRRHFYIIDNKITHITSISTDF